MAQRNDVAEISLAFEKALKNFPQHRKELLEAVGEKGLAVLRGHIAQTVHDQTGRIASGQERQVGSRGGYVSLHPIYEKGGGRDSIKPVTTFLDRGHAVMVKSGGDSYRMAGFVKGRGFYTAARMEAARIVDTVSAELERKLADDLS